MDYLAFTRHYRIGVDICYSYGLLPILLQHIVFWFTGPSFRPMIGCTVLVLVLTAIYFACLLEHLPAGRLWLVALVALSPTLLIVNPNWPYSVAVLSMLFAILFVLKDRLDIALAISTIGCFCVPSLPLVLTILLAFCIIFNWWKAQGRSFSTLVARLAPGAIVYAALAVLLGTVFGFRSLAATAIPLTGATYYKQSGLGGLGAFIDFLHPAGHSMKYYVAYYLGSPVTWFVLCTLFIFGLSLCVLFFVLRGRALDPSSTLIVVYSVVQAAFITVAYGTHGQHVLYDGLLASTALVGIASIPKTKMRNTALLVFILSGILAESSGAYKTLDAWRSTAPGPGTFGLYAGVGLAKDWSDVVQVSQHRKTLVLAYATGQHIYYPTIEEPDAWFMIPGLIYPAQENAILEQIRNADIVVEDGTSPSPIVTDKIRSALAAMHEIHPGGAYRFLEH